MIRNPLEGKIYRQRRIARDCEYRGDYFRDQTALIHSLPFRRLKHKTQVFFAPENDHVCTRIEHVLHVATVASAICKGLNASGKWALDPEMAYAIGLGHDLGHAPFGHTGENTLNSLLESTCFKHEIHGLRVVDHLANNGPGLNLTYGVRDGIICHCGEKFEKSLKPRSEIRNLSRIKDRTVTPASYEGCVARFSDKAAYLGRDIEDAVKAGFLNINDVPGNIRSELGESNGEIINNLVVDIIKTSSSRDEISLSDEKYELLLELKKFNYENIYQHKRIQRYEKYCKKIIETVFDYLKEIFSDSGFAYEHYSAPDRIKLDRHFGKYIQKTEKFYSEENASPKRVIGDYIAGMTDSYALDCMNQISIPKPIEFK